MTQVSGYSVTAKRGDKSNELSPTVLQINGKPQPMVADAMLGSTVKGDMTLQWEGKALVNRFTISACGKDYPCIMKRTLQGTHVMSLKLICADFTAMRWRWRRRRQRRRWRRRQRWWWRRPSTNHPHVLKRPAAGPCQLLPEPEPITRKMRSQVIAGTRQECR